MYRILWYSPYALHDLSSGAAFQCRGMLEWLCRCYAGRLEVTVLCATVFDDPRGAHFLRGLGGEDAGAGELFCFEHNGLTCHYLKAAASRDRDLRSGDKRPLLERYLQLLREFRPDLLIGYGDDPLFRAVYADAARRGIPGVYCVCNPNYRPSSFAHCERVLTDSRATAAYYAQASGINFVSVGTFIDPDLVRAAPGGSRSYVTLINPSLNKGLSLFVRIASMAREQLPGQRFLLVVNRGSLQHSLAQLHDGDRGRQESLWSLPDNVDVMEHTDDVREVYAVTRVLLAPSLWFECWGRVATEAVLNGIPVLCSRSGGLPEASGAEQGAAVCLEAPAPCRRDYRLVPDAMTMQPWLDALKRLLDGDFTAACARAAELHDPRHSAQRVMAALEPLLARHAGRRARMLRSGLVLA